MTGAFRLPPLSKSAVQIALFALFWNVQFWLAGVVPEALHVASNRLYPKRRANA